MKLPVEARRGPQISVTPVCPPSYLTWVLELTSGSLEQFTLLATEPSLQRRSPALDKAMTRTVAFLS